MEETTETAAPQAPKTQLPQGVEVKIGKEEFFKQNCEYIQRKIDTYDRLIMACQVKIKKILDAHADITVWQDLPNDALLELAELEIKLQDAQSARITCEFEKGELVRNLELYLMQVNHYRDEMHKNWDYCIERLTEITNNLRTLRKPAQVEQNTLNRCFEDFVDENEKIEWYRTMIDVLGDRFHKKQGK